MGLKTFLEKQSENFGKDGRYSLFYPIFEMVDTFLYTPSEVNKGSVHIRDRIDLKRIMSIVVIALIPSVFMALLNTGFQANLAAGNLANSVESWRFDVLQMLGLSPNSSSFLSNIVLGALYFLPLYIMTLIVGGFWEVLFAVVRKRKIEEAFLVTSLLYPLILPPGVPLWQAAVALSLGIVLGKEIFGGTGRNVVNPALISRAMLFFSYPATMSGDKVWVAVDGVTKATPLTYASHSGMSGMQYSLWDAFIGFVPGSMGETSALACLIGAFILIVTGIGSWQIMLSMLIGMLCFTGLFYIIGSDTNPMFGVSPVWHLVSGGFAFGLVFMATDPVSAAITQTGKYIYGFLIGGLTALIRVVNPAFPEGVMLAIIFGNIFAPIIDDFVINANIKRRMRRNEA
ncbi:NADH:ubiquinone oxidoreductase, subunit B [Flexistipes sinusarabici DSM 4947]|uniref:Na(+)-translocating NADH-quinone reductase subunit B n=1 Tax=Flexistipes sinusarabici (strain ATCC 49648 / DSM 4947 / MAS 10) TaxID=717231 RepID=F8E4B1_FLESM|nr:NADH:ubiquinone reductase (Na(+)-transporting) subunit B [Flexistipes sinusarabici]AEI15538.1 NADH:ubiquinone oxidoreductase, subunit B [Flexistipes sinusarabici DSM 4947]